jgi:choline dehydrogenase-like flavoprotein
MIGGAAGSVIASGLANSARRPSVLLIEAGGEGLNTSNLRPFDRYTNAFTLPELDYGFETVPQKGLGGKILKYFSGKGLGGSTMLNFMVYTRGPSSDWDRWAEIVDDNDWSWDRILQRYRKVSDLHYIQ